MLRLLSCQSGGRIGSFLGPCCLHTPLLKLIDALTRFLYQFQILLKDDHEIDWIMGIVFMHSNQELRRQVERQCRCIGVLCSIASVVLPRVRIVFASAVLCGIDSVVIVYNLWVLVAGRQDACWCFHGCRSIKSGLEGVQRVHGLSAL